jgi:WS/DGAT/MGAT family acyltransferase
VCDERTVVATWRRGSTSLVAAMMGGVSGKIPRGLMNERTDEHYERLSATESALLAFETAHNHMHVGIAVTFDGGPLRRADGGVDADRIRAHIASRLHLAPRYRQRLAWVPIENHPVWVDAERVDLGYHVRHASLPKPGTDQQLKHLAAHLMSQPLDRTRPLWELWVVEGLAGGRFALVVKAHHCLADGASGLDTLFSVVTSPVPEQPPQPARPWEPRSIPSALSLVRDAVLRRAWTPVEIARQAGDALRAAGRGGGELSVRLSALARLIATAVPGPADTPLNGPTSPHRRIEWHCLDLAEVKEVKNRLGGSVNDVALATVAGAIGALLRRRGVSTDGLDYRVMIPADIRAPGEHASVRISGWLMPFPVDERQPRRRFRRIAAATSYMKASRQVLGAETLFALGGLAGPPLFGLGVRLASWLAPYNLIVTNIPGPPSCFYLLGAPLRDAYPLCPLFENQALAVALLSYNGKLFVGINADRDRVPDLGVLVEEIDASFARLRRAAGAGGALRRRGQVQGPRPEDTLIVPAAGP